MRQVFTSQRLENVEGVAQLLREAGIEVRIRNGRSYKGNRRGNFSYRQSPQAGPQPSLWVVKSEDQPRARQLLRDAGLMRNTRLPDDSYLPASARADDAAEAARKSPDRRAMRIKLALLAGIVIVLVLVLFR